MTVKTIEFQSEEYNLSVALRNEVLRKPLGLDIADEDLSDEGNQIHFVAIENDKVVGTVTLISNYKKGIGKLRQMATSDVVRGKGYGIALVRALEEHSVQLGLEKIVLHSRHYAVGFYEKQGYKITSDIFQEVGMDHFVMEKRLS